MFCYSKYSGQFGQNYYRVFTSAITTDTKIDFAVDVGLAKLIIRTLQARYPSNNLFTTNHCCWSACFYIDFYTDNLLDVLSAILL